jgi:hypothetical protein
VAGLVVTGSDSLARVSDVAYPCSSPFRRTRLCGVRRTSLSWAPCLIAAVTSDLAGQRRAVEAFLMAARTGDMRGQLGEPRDRAGVGTEDDIRVEDSQYALGDGLRFDDREDIVNGRIVSIDLVANPEKLRHLRGGHLDGGTSG